MNICFLLFYTAFVTLRATMSDKLFFRQIQTETLIPLLDKMATDRGALADLARKLETRYGMRHAKNRLAELRSGKRELSFYFLNILINGGIMSVSQIMRGRTLEELNPVERDIVLKLTADPEVLELLHQAKAEGVDVKQLLKATLRKK